jgi:hypothetical protein
MTTPRIEEMVEECYFGAKATKPEDARQIMRDCLTKAHQAGIDEAANVAHDIFGEVDEFWELMDKFEKALQDNK